MLLFLFDLKLIGDNDSAGSKFNSEVTRLFSEKGKIVKTVCIPHEFNDLNDWLSRRAN